jgi:small GTP-binding protein
MSYKQNSFVDTVPTVGLNIEQITFRSYLLTMWDVGGQATKLWKHYFDHIDAIVFVVDWTSTDKVLAKAQTELHKLAKDKALQEVPVLIILNKEDLK